MWLSRIELKNFKSYRQQVFEFPQPQAGKNLVLIGGINGYGKTTLLEAIYVGLYGEEAITQKALDSAGLKTKSYGHFLETAFNRLAPSQQEERMEVSVEFTHEDHRALRITRKWFFNGKGKYDTQTVVIETRVKSGTWMLNPSNMQTELLENYAIPPWLAPFFFFDGEKIAGLAEEGRTEWIQSGLENLLGVGLVSELREQLAEYSYKKLREVGGADKQKVDELKQQLEGNKKTESTLTEAITALRQQISTTSEERDRLQNKLAALAQGSDARTVAEVAEKREQTTQRVNQCWNKLRELYAVQLPLQLIQHSLYEKLESTMLGEQSLMEWEQSKARMQPNWEKFSNTFFGSPWITWMCNQPMSTARNELEKTLSDAWESLHYPRPTECVSEIWHTYMQANERRKLSDMRSKSQVSAADLRQALVAHEQAEKEQSRLQNELIRLEGVNGEGKAQQIEQLKQELQSAQTKLDADGRELGAKENEYRALQGDINSQTASYERERTKLADSHPERQAAQEAEKIVRMIDELLPRLFDLKLKALSETVTRIYRELHHKDQVARIEISRDGRATLFSHEGTEINLPKSSGESQLFVLALVGALAEVTGYRVPMIIDTPLARLSETHCNNLLKYWTSDPKRQVILLAQDKEVGVAEYRDLLASVSKTFLLQHSQVREGVGSSRAIENSYFEEQV